MVTGEFRKLFQRRTTIFLILLLFLVNGVLVWNLEIPGGERYFSIEATHIRSLYAALPEDAAQALAALEQQREVLSNATLSGSDPGELLTEDIYTERRLFANVTERVEEAANYPALLREIDENAETLLLTGQYEENSFGYRNILKSRAVYQNLEDVTLEVFYSGAVELLSGGRITDLILILLCLLGGLELVTSEKTSGTMGLIRPAYKGRLPLISAKILTGILLAVVGTLVLYGSNLLIGFARCGFVPMDAPVQSVFGFARSPWKLTVGGYIAGFFGMKFLWAGAATALVFASCCLGRDFLESCGLILLLAGIHLAFSEEVWSLAFAGDTVELFAQYRNLNCFGWPVSTFTASILTMCLTCVLGFGASAAFHTLTPMASAGRTSKCSRKYRISTNLFLHEGRKVLLMNGGLWVLVALIAVQCVTYFDFNEYIGPQERLYMQYSEILAGSADPQKEEFLAEEEARFAELYARLDEAALAFSQGELKQETYNALCSGIMRQLENEPAFLRSKDQYERMKAQGYDYVCQSGYDRLLGTKGKRELLRQTMYLALALIAGLSGICAVEHETGMELLLNSTPRKSDSLKRKVLLGALFAAVSAFIVYVPQIAAIASAYGLPGLSSPAGSVPGLKVSFGTVGTSLTVYGALALLLAIGMAIGVLWISGKTKRTVQSCLYSAVAFLLPLAAAMLWLI